MTRALIGNISSVEHYFLAADDETPANPDLVSPGVYTTITVTGTKADATAITPSTATLSDANLTPGLCAYVTPAYSEYDEIELSFSTTIDSQTVVGSEFVKVVGGRFFTLAQLRSQRGLANTTTYTNAHLAAARDIVEDLIEHFTDNAWVPQHKREVFDGDGCSELFLSRIGARRIISASISGTSQTTTAWTISASGRILSNGVPFATHIAKQNVVIAYEWGAKRPPRDLANASLRLAKHILLSTESSIPDRARMMQTEWGMFQLDAASEQKPTGIPEIDSVLMRYRYEQPGWIVV